MCYAGSENVAWGANPAAGTRKTPTINGDAFAVDRANCDGTDISATFYRRDGFTFRKPSRLFFAFLRKIDPILKNFRENFRSRRSLLLAKRRFMRQ